MTPGEAWDLIEQGLLPSERERACDEFRDLLARIWDEGWEQGMAYVTGMERGIDDDHAITNPYRASETA